MVWRGLIGASAALLMAAACPVATAAAATEQWNLQRLDDLSFWDAASLKRDGDGVVYREVRVIQDFNAYGDGSMTVGHLVLVMTYSVSCSSRVRTPTAGIAVYDAKGRLKQSAGRAEGGQGAVLRQEDPMSKVLDGVCGDAPVEQPAGLTSIKAAVADVARRGN